jgi:hypothetical protein
MNAFDQLLDELSTEYSGRARGQKSPSVDGLRKALAIGEDGMSFDVHPSDVAIAGLFRRIVGVVLSQAQQIRDLQKGHELLAALEPTGGKPMNKSVVVTARQVGNDFMAKAMEAQSAGRISGAQVAIAEAHLNAGKAPPADILRAVVADAA